ncbi:TetR/AcrR family transcriptional regulator [Pseudonocardia acaciae]|uniref:TetR/AcrR family transcriptional regulator n=1 Tax=Pseudonocardia acaciae TaxID=551276 RepID=UPI00055B8A96|nr:TetR/AcrR family transcriptional regulator [Pseudonocardia acaciae]
MTREFADRIVAARAPRRETKSLIYQHALRLFATRGYARASLREIAEAVGLEVASLYTHIQSKQALLFDLMEFGNRDLLERLVAAAGGATDRPLPQLYVLTRENVLSHCRHRHQTTVVYNEIRELNPEQREHIVALRRKIEELFRSQLRRGIEDGSVRPLDVATTTFGILAMGRGAAGWYREDGRLTAEQIADGYADQTVRAVAATAQLQRIGDEPINLAALS